MSAPNYPLYANGQYYDAIYDTYAGDHVVAFYADLATQAGGEILELACGTGRIAIPLARRGFSVTGIDVADAMLQQARAKSKTEGLQIEWHTGDVRDFDLGKRFGLVFLPSNALCHLLTRNDFESAMACVRRHMDDGARFVVDVFVPAPQLLVDKGDERFPYSEFDTPEGRVVLTGSFHYESHTQVRRNTTYHTYEDGREESGALDMRMYFPQELDALLEYNGLCIESKLSSFDGQPFGDGCGQQLIVCTQA